MYNYPRCSNEFVYSKLFFKKNNGNEDHIDSNISINFNYCDSQNGINNRNCTYMLVRERTSPKDVPKAKS